jgi:hypothetical protein
MCWAGEYVMGSEISYDGVGTLDWIAIWRSIPAPRRRLLIWFAVLNLVLIASMALLPIAFSRREIEHREHWYVEWIWGAANLSEMVGQTPYINTAPFTELLITGLIFLTINVLLFIAILLCWPSAKVDVSRLLTICTWAWATWAGIFVVYCLMSGGFPGPSIFVILIVVNFMTPMYHPLGSTAAETSELAGRYEEIVAHIGDYLETKDVTALRNRLTEFKLDSERYGSNNYVFEARRYLACLPRLEILYNEAFNNKVFSLSYLQTKLNMDDEDFPVLIMGLTTTFNSTITKDLISFTKPIDRDLFVRTVRRLLDDIRTTTMDHNADRAMRSAASMHHG